MAKNAINKQIKCYLCNKELPKLYTKKLGYFILRCPKCTLLSLDFKDDYKTFLKNYYNKSFFVGNKIIRAYTNYAQDKANILKNAKTLLNNINNLKPSGKLLDVGCALGFFMEEAVNRGFEAYGIEVSKYAADIAQIKFGKKIFYGSVEEYCQKKDKLPQFKKLAFDVIIFSDFIEHVQDPRTILKNLRSSLKNDGVIIIQTGDSSSLWARLAGKNWHFFAPPQHLFYFSKKTITELLSQAGYKVQTINKKGKHLSINYVLHLSQYMNIPKIGDLLFNYISKTPLGRLSIPIKLFDNMIVVAKKHG